VLRGLIDFLLTAEGLRMFKAAYRENMLFKVRHYRSLRDRASEEASKYLEVAQAKVEALKAMARIQGEGDNWTIFESVAGPLKDAEERVVLFSELERRAEERLSAPGMGTDDLARDRREAIVTLRDELVERLGRLCVFTASQVALVTQTARLLHTFLKNPTVFRTKLMNFMLVGGAGTGKTLIATAIGDVFAKAGIFVGSNLVLAGRGDLVASYEGQTVARTRAFLTSNLESVVFVDEAYAVTPWQAGKPEGYGSEVVAAMVEFMTRYVGLYCIIVAGYEKEMTRYFLPSNEGLSSRFPHKFVLRNYASQELITIFQRHLLRLQGLPEGEGPHLASYSYFTSDAWKYLHRLVELSMTGSVEFRPSEYDAATQCEYPSVRVFKPSFPCMHEIFKYQGRSMANLASDAYTHLVAAVPYETVLEARRHSQRSGQPLRLPIPRQPQRVMHDIVVQRILTTALSHSDVYLEELDHMERVLRF